MAERTRTYSWDDPHEALLRGEGLSGLELLRAMAAGELPPPPIAQTLGFHGFQVGEGTATFMIAPAEFHYNPIGSVHGSLALALILNGRGASLPTPEAR